MTPSEDHDQRIAEAKRAVWAQPGAGQEYQYFAYKGSPVKRLKNLVEINFVTRHVKGSLVLDAGAGTGRFTFPLRQRGMEVMALDISAEMLGEGVNVSRKTGVPFPCGIGLIEQLPFADATFDSVVSITVLRHFPEWGAILREYLRVLKPGGRLVFDMASGEQRQYAAGHGLLPDAQGDPLQFEIGASAPELEALAGAANCAIVTAIPHDFLNDNPVLRQLVGGEWPAFEAALHRLLDAPHAIECCELLSRRFLPVTSPVLSPSRLIVLEKGTPGSRTIPRPYLAAKPTDAPALSPYERFQELFRALLGYRFNSCLRELEAFFDHPECRELMELLSRVLMSEECLRLLVHP